MGFADVDPVAFQAIVFQQPGVAGLELAIARQVVDRGGQAVAPHPPRNTTGQVQGILKATRQGLEGFRVTKMEVLPVGIGEDRMEHQVREGLAADGYPQFSEVHEIEGHQIRWLMVLGKHDFLLNIMFHFPGLHPPLQTATYRIADLSRVLFLEPLQNRKRLQSRFRLQTLRDAWPIGCERILASPILARLSRRLAGQLLRTRMFPHGIFRHPQSPRDLPYLHAGIPQTNTGSRLPILDHRKPSMN
jgi:hypothetical protein